MLDLEPIKELWLSGGGANTIFIAHIRALVAEVETLCQQNNKFRNILESVLFEQASGNPDQVISTGLMGEIYNELHQV